jgi:alpha-ribazole phosphatase
VREGGLEGPAALELWLVRHGESLWNLEGRVQGQRDPALTDGGRQAARHLRPRLARATFDAVFTSDLARAQETACLALPGRAARPDARLRELAFGTWEGRRWREVAEEDGAALRAWYEDPYAHAPTGGERYEALLARVTAWRRALPARGRVLAFTHGGPILALLYSLTGTPQGGRWRFAVPPASLTKLVLGDRGAILQTVGDVAHLEEATDLTEGCPR